jgi:hypothetical protein
VNKYQSIQESAHYSLLNKSYDGVGQETWENKDFNESSLDVSRGLFTEDSLKTKNPRPKNLEVYALLSGLPFENSFSRKLVKIQQKIDKILDGSLRYWVLQENLGLEYCVFKWPEHDWNKQWEGEIYNNLPRLNKPFRFVVFGIQINPDGCIIAKGFDEGEVIFKLRKKLKERLDFLPDRQSSWAHIPLGRILEPIGGSKFYKLSQLCKELSNIYIASCEINTMKFVHETQWYMEKKNILREFRIGDSKIKIEGAG